MYDWSEEQQGIILGAFFWGYTLTQIPGGMLSQRYGGKYVFMLGILFSAVCSLLTPNVVRLGNIHTNLNSHIQQLKHLLTSIVVTKLWRQTFFICLSVCDNFVSYFLSAEANGLIILRVFSGLGEGTMYAGLTDLLAAWVPLQERTTLASLAYGGSTVLLKWVFSYNKHTHATTKTTENNNLNKIIK